MGDEGRALFLPTHTSFLKQLTQVYSDQGIIAALKTASLHNQVVVSHTALLILKTIFYLKKAQIVLNPMLKFNIGELIDELSGTRNWGNNPIRCLSWHPHSARLAVATNDDSVRVYCNDNTFVPLLRSKEQKSITCLAWRPMSLTEIAVGHGRGIIIWNVDFNLLVSRPSSSNTIMLCKVEHHPILSLAWSPIGDVLISAAGLDPTILVWDVELKRTSLLKPTRESGNILVKWSPAKDKLLTVSNGVVFRFFKLIFNDFFTFILNLEYGTVRIGKMRNGLSHLDEYKQSLGRIVAATFYLQQIKNHSFLD